MKINRKKILSLFLAITIVSTCAMQSSALSQNVNNGLKPKILSNYTRKELNTSYKTEEKISDYERDYSTIANDKSKSILDSFDIKHDNIKDVDFIKDNTLDREVYRAESDDAEIDFDEDGNVVKIFNKNDFDRPDQQTTKYEENANADNSNKYMLNTSEDLQSIIDNIASQNDLEGYVLVSCSNSLEGTWVLVWHKDLGNGVLNGYDVASTTIDAKDGSIMIFGRKTVLPNTNTPIVTEKQALKFAKPIFDKFEKPSITSVKLTTFRPNFYWEMLKNNEAYEEADFIRLAWAVTIDSGATIDIDAETGEILGGDQPQATGRAAETPGMYNETIAFDCANHAYAGLNALGYDQSNDNLVNYALDQADAEWLLREEPNLRALYLRCHGVVNTNGTSANAVTDRKNWTVYSSDVRHSGWEFVYLDACKTASTSTFANAFGIYSFSSNKFYMGWGISVLQTVQWRFTCNFWNYAMNSNDDGSRSLKTAIDQAKFSTTVDGGYTDAQVDIRYYGDEDWNGWAY